MGNKMLSRRAFVVASATTLGTLALSGCANKAEQDSPPASETPAPEPTAAASNGKTLVTCFSATGNTRAVAQTLAKQLGADYFELEPAEPYTEDDLNYSDETTRATAEQNDPKARPPLATTPDVASYDAVLLGHPIWWGKAPRVICTLLETCDLSHKSIAEFCTSGSSGIENAASELKEVAPDIEWIGAMRFAAGASETQVAEWADSLNLQ